jgi:hypothetical protein
VKSHGEGGNTFIRNGGELAGDYMAERPRGKYPSRSFNLIKVGTRIFYYLFKLQMGFYPVAVVLQ